MLLSAKVWQHYNEEGKLQAAQKEREATSAL